MKIRDITNSWRAAAGRKNQRKPKGTITLLVNMRNEWSSVPNALYEDESGELWLMFGSKDGTCVELEPTIPVTVAEALMWLQQVSEFADDYEADIADVCRIALREISSRPGRKAAGPPSPGSPRSQVLPTSLQNR
jgi:hypothetical protein